MEVLLTVSPPLRSIRDQRAIFDDDMYFLMKIRLCSKHFIIYPEFDKSGRLHYHGIIRIIDKIKWYKSVLPTLRRSLGFCDIKTIGSTMRDKLQVLYYIKKEWMVTKKVLNIDEPIIPKHRRKIIHVNTSDLDFGILKQFCPPS